MPSVDKSPRLDNHDDIAKHWALGMKIHLAQKKEIASSTTFVAIILVLALLVTTFAAVLTIGQIGSPSETNSANSQNLDPSSNTSTSSHTTITTRGTSSSTITSTTHTTSKTISTSDASSSYSTLTIRTSTTTINSTTSSSYNVLVYGNATVGDFTGECGGGFHPTGVTFTTLGGVNFDSPVTNLSYYPSNNTGPGPSLEAYATGKFALSLPNFEMYNVTIQQDNYCNSNNYYSSCPAGSLYLYALSTTEQVKADCTTDSTVASHGYAVMFLCVEGCIQNLTGNSFNDTNAPMAWGINESSYGGYSGGIAYNPACGLCSTNITTTQYGYEYPWPYYATYAIQPIGVFSYEPYVNVTSVLFGVAYGGAGNHIFTTPQYPMTIRVDVWQVPITNWSIYTSYPLCNTSGACTQFQFLNSTYITVYPNSSCGGFSSNRNETCS